MRQELLQAIAHHVGLPVVDFACDVGLVMPLVIGWGSVPDGTFEVQIADTVKQFITRHAPTKTQIDAFHARGFRPVALASTALNGSGNSIVLVMGKTV